MSAQPAEPWRARLPARCPHLYGRSKGLLPNQCAECRQAAGEDPPVLPGDPPVLAEDPPQRPRLRRVQ